MVQKKILIAGAGPIASVYADVLKALGIPFEACSRSSASASAFSRQHEVACHSGGLAALCSSDLSERFSQGVVALPVEALAEGVFQLHQAGLRKLLVEKPGGLDNKQVRALVDSIGAEASEEIYVAYNRRFYASVLTAKRLISEDGGAVSFTFEFTELSDRVRQLESPADLLAAWEFANSTHVLDTAFFLGGVPAEVNGLRQGQLDFHPAAARYAGMGHTTDGVPFTYIADWDAPGRWGVEINTRHRKFVLRPMEQLAVQHRNTFAIEPVTLDDEDDKRFKPGYFRQLQAFLYDDDKQGLLSLKDQASQLDFFAENIFFPSL